MIPITMPRLEHLYPDKQPKYFKIIGIRGERIIYELRIIHEILTGNKIAKDVADEIIQNVIDTGVERINPHLPLPSNEATVKFLSGILNEVLQEELHKFQLDGIVINDKGQLYCKAVKK